MLIYLIALILVVISFNAFAITYQANGINRVVVSTPIPLLEKYVELYGENSLLINIKEGKKALEKYYNQNLSKYTPNYTLTYYPYNAGNGSYCVHTHCSAIEVRVEATLSFNFRYDKTFYYEVKNNYE